MARFFDLFFLAVAAVVVAFLAVAEASTLGFDLHHRFSPVVRKWAEARGHKAAEWPAQGSPEYYSALSRHDRAHLARRGLAGAADPLVTFADGNETYLYLGYLHYAFVAVGTPNTTFLVALDTGSDLFWVPCECKQCAPLSNNDTSSLQLRPYSPAQSSTSKRVGCDNALCNQPSNACSAATNGRCPYSVRYVSANTSSSGVLVEDFLHLTGEAPGPGAATQPLQAPIVFGCGQVQTGLFLDGGGAFDGLMGLGMDKVSVPSLLASNRVVASDSFSMCFGDDGVGRINFGDAGSSDQAETPFVVSSTRPTYYNVSFTSINVGGKSAPVEFAAIMDSGTSFTYLSDPEYTEFANTFESQIRDKRTNFSTGSGDPFPFEYCYNLSTNQKEPQIPDVSLTTMGGALFPVTQPIIGVVQVDNNVTSLVGYCLAIMRSDISINIVGQNFMTGLKVVFNREKSVLGWQKFDCYKNARVADAPGGSPSPSPSFSPAPAGSPTKVTPQQSDASNRSSGAAPQPAATPGSSNAAACALGGLSLLLPLLLAAALV